MVTSSKGWTVFAHSDIVIVGSNPTWAMDVSVNLLCVPSCVQVAALYRADPRSASPIDFAKDQESAKAAKAQQRAANP
jgi:hypothetical protein